MTPNTRRTIIERHHGWEGASPALLARVFKTSHQRITAIVSQKCANCGRSICGCRDDEWAGRSAPALFLHAHPEAARC